MKELYATLATFRRAGTLAILLACCFARAASWRTVSVEDYGAKGDNSTDNTAAFRQALLVVRTDGGGEVIVPDAGVFRTAPFNLSSNVLLRVEGVVRGVDEQAAFPVVGVLPSYGHDTDTNGPARRHPLVWAVDARNVTIAGRGTIDGAGELWWPNFYNKSIPGAHIGRPHLVEMLNVTGVDIRGVTLLNSAFWTLHPTYCRDVHIHDMRIVTPWCQQYKCANTDGIDVDSSSDVLIERNYISCGDDHVTILSGAGAAGRAFAMPSRNVTVRDNRLGTGMGMTVGSSISGGIEGVLYQNNVMEEQAGEWGQGAHIKTRVTYGGYIRDAAWVDNVIQVAGSPGGALVIESGYQSAGQCTADTCTQVSGIVFRNLTVHKGGLGSIDCYPARPCENVTFEDVHINATGTWSCKNVASGTVKNVSPPGLAEACGFAPAPAPGVGQAA